eukprot:401798-Prorocentrum_minimum.AAC.3
MSLACAQSIMGVPLKTHRSARVGVSNRSCALRTPSRGARSVRLQVRSEQKIGEIEMKKSGDTEKFEDGSYKVCKANRNRRLYGLGYGETVANGCEKMDE